MLKKSLLLLLILILIFPASVYSNNLSNVHTKKDITSYKVTHTLNSKEIIIVKDFTDKGVIGLSLANSGDFKIKLLIRKKNEKTYIYDLRTDETLQYFPLQSGSGEYDILILESSNGTGYHYIKKETVYADIDNRVDIFLNPISYNDWRENPKFTSLINDITKNDTSDKEVIQSVYEYMVKNFKYDYKKAKKVKSGYLPDISLLLDKQSGICYDYAAIFSAALRYKGIPVKIVKGTSDYVTSYHAWNEVYIDNIWVIVDLTIDSFYNTRNINYNFTKEAGMYNAKKVY